MKERMIYALDDCTGEYGFLLKGVNTIDSYPSVSPTGSLIAHDLLEHQQGVVTIGSVGDELIALGGVWKVRGELGMINQKSTVSPEQHLVSDVVNLAEIYIGGVPMREDTKPYRKTDTFYWVDEVAKYAKKELMENYDYTVGEVVDYLEKAKYLMRKGYNMAERRFKNCPCPYSLYSNIAYVIDEIQYPEEYQEWEIQYSFTTGSASLKEIANYYY
jgi:hypothetical protein